MSTPVSIFGEHDGQRSALEQVALAATAADFGDRPGDLLVIALHPERDARKVIASPGNSAVRAAISVAVAAGNVRAWADVVADEIVDVPVAALPEIIRAAVEPCGIHFVQVAVVREADEIACYTMWLSPSVDPDLGARDRHARAVAQLAAAATADRVRAEEQAARAAAIAAARAAEAGDRDVARATSGAMALLDALPGHDHLARVLNELVSDEAAVMVLSIDDAEGIAARHGEDGLRGALQVVAQRLLDSVRKHDVIAYIDDVTFALVLVNVDRRTAFEVSRRLRGVLSEPMPEGDWPDALSISVGLAHEDGLIDANEMFAAATSAMHDARLEGGARMLIAC